MATLTPVLLARPSEVTPWGFRLEGGADYKKPLLVQKVTAGSIASQQLSAGDALIMLEGEDARALCHFDACDLVKNSGRKLSMTVRKASSVQYLHDENISNQERLEQTVVDEQKQQEVERMYRRAMSTPPRDGALSNRSTPQRVLSPSNNVMSPRMMQSPSCRAFSPQLSTENQATPSPKQMFSSPIQRFQRRSIPPSPRSNIDPSSGGVLSPQNVTSIQSPAGVASPRHIMSPPNIMSPPTVRTPVAAVRSPPNMMSPPNIISPPPRYPALPTNQSFSSSDKFYTPPPLPQTFNAGVDESSASAYSTPGQFFSPHQFHSAQSPQNQVDRTAVDESDNSGLIPEQLTDKLVNLQEQEGWQQEHDGEPLEPQGMFEEAPLMGEDLQRRQLQMLIQEKLRLEEKMMIAKRREGRAETNRQERMAKNTIVTQKKESKQEFATPKVKSQITSDSNEANYGKHEVITKKSCREETVQKFYESSTNYSASHTEQNSTNTKYQKEIVLSKTNFANPAVDPNDEANKMLERIKKTARDKIADFQKTLSGTRSLDDNEKERLREENRIRDEEIRKMQEQNFDEKQKRGSAKSACSPIARDSKAKPQELRRVKTDAKPIQPAVSQPGGSISHEVITEPVAAELTIKPFKLIPGDKLVEQEKKKREASKKNALVNKNYIVDEKVNSSSDADEKERMRIKDIKRKEEIRKLQEQFKKDQQLIQEEMRKKEMRAREEKTRKQEEEAQKKLKLEEERKAEEKKILAKIIYDEEQKLVEQKRQLEEKIRRAEFEKAEEIRKLEVQKKIERERENARRGKEVKTNEEQGPNQVQKDLKEMDEKQGVKRKVKTHKRSIQESYERSKMKAYEQKRVEMQKAVQMQHTESARKLNEHLKKQGTSSQGDADLYEDIGNTEQTPEERLEALRLEEERQMREEAKQYEDYRRHLEAKRKLQMEDSDDYASEWDETSEASNLEAYSNQGNRIKLEEPFDELKATSEEELLEAQEKSIRNLERQIRRQRDKEKLKNAAHKRSPKEQEHYEQKQKLQKIPGYQKPVQKKNTHQNRKDLKPYASTGDLSKSNSKTLPITKFSPDPMEFGFKPIESPVLSKSLSNLEMGGSAAAGAAVAGAQAGAKATAEVAAAQKAAEEKRRTEALEKTHFMSASLGDLQQVSSKPPLPASAVRARMRHATSDELLNRNTEHRPYDESRRFTYADGENLESLNLEPLRQEQGLPVGSDEEEEMDLEDMEDYNKLVSEYYAAYYEAYYKSYYLKQQEELKSGKISTMNGPAGPPPPPPPPPFVVAGATPPVMPEPVQVSRPAPRSAPIMPLVAPPAALAGAMMKDKKPFTYTPGGLDLSEIRSPRMQRRLSRNAALEGARPSPLAQHSSTGSPTPGSPSPSVPSGLAVQVLPMPGMAMAKSTPATPPPPAQPKEPVVKKSMCGPPPPPPPFTIGSGDFKLSPPETKSVPSVSKAIASPPMTSYIPNEPVLTTPSSPPFSSPPSDPRSTSLSLASTNSNDSGTNIPAPPPPPPQSAAARRASIVKNSLNGDSTPPTPIAVAPPFQNQAHAAQSQAPFKGPEGSEVKTNNTSAAASSDISSNSFAESDTSRSRESSSMAVEDSSTSFREESVTPSVLSNVDRPEEDMEHYNSNESLLKQISALEQITAKHQSKQESSSGLRVSNGNARIGSNTPERQASEPKVQPILRLSVSKQQSSQKQHEEDMRRKEFEQHERRKELEELERQKQFEEHERQVQLEEQERQRQFEEHERQIQIEKQERQMQLEEQEMHQRQMEEHDRERQLQKERQQEIDRQKQQEIERQKQQEMERQRQQEMERQRQQEMECQKQQEMERQRQQEMERLRQQEMEHQKQQEMERQRQQEMDRQRQQEMEQQELERQRQQEMEQKREQEKFEQQQEAERKQQQQERLRQQEESHQRQKEEEEQRQLEAQRRQELENQKLREEQEWQRHQEEEEQVRLEEQERKRYQMQQQQPENQNRFKRQGSVPIQVRQAPFRADTNQQQNQVDSQGNPHVRASSASRSPNVSPTSGLIKAPLPWMSAIPRRETSAPPEFVNYAQTAQSRLQQQRAQRQQSYEQGKAPQAPSPVLKEAVVVAPPVVYQHPGQNDYGRSTLPRNSKLNSGPAQRPWVAKHQQYQQQPQQTSAQLPAQSPSYQQPQQVQRPGPGQRWPEVKQPNYLRQKSASEESNQRTVASGSQKIRIIPITVEQDSSSDQEQPYYPSSGNNSTIRSIPINSTYGPAYQVPVNISNTSIPPSPRTPQTPPTRAPLSSTTPPSPRWNQQPSFIAPPPQQQQQPKQQRFSLQQQQQQPPPPSTQQPQKVNYNNPIGLYSDGNAVEALQQMQQSLAQLNTGLQNAYPKFIQETISNSLPTRSVSSPGPGVVTAPDMNSAPMQSRSFRILQNVVDSEASGSEDELRGYLPQDTPEAYHTAQVKTFTGGVSSPRGGGGRRSSGYAPSPLAQQVPQQYAKYHDDGDDDPRGSSDPKASKIFRCF